MAPASMSSVPPTDPRITALRAQIDDSKRKLRELDTQLSNFPELRGQIKIELERKINTLERSLNTYMQPGIGGIRGA